METMEVAAVWRNAAGSRCCGAGVQGQKGAREGDGDGAVEVGTSAVLWPVFPAFLPRGEVGSFQGCFAPAAATVGLH